MPKLGNARLAGVNLYRCCDDMDVADYPHYFKHTQCHSCHTIVGGETDAKRAEEWNALIASRIPAHQRRFEQAVMAITFVVGMTLLWLL